jgi:hypothetical protein
MNPFSVIGHQSLVIDHLSLVICHSSLPGATSSTPMSIRHFPGQCRRRTHFVNVIQHQKSMTNDQWMEGEWQILGKAELLNRFHCSLFIVDCSFVIVEYGSSGNGK